VEGRYLQPPYASPRKGSRSNPPFGTKVLCVLRAYIPPPSEGTITAAAHGIVKFTKTVTF